MAFEACVQGPTPEILNTREQATGGAFISDDGRGRNSPGEPSCNTPAGWGRPAGLTTATKTSKTCESTMQRQRNEYDVVKIANLCASVNLDSPVSVLGLLAPLTLTLPGLHCPSLVYSLASPPQTLSRFFTTHTTCPAYRCLAVLADPPPTERI